MPRTKKQAEPAPSKPPAKGELRDRLNAMQVSANKFKAWKPAGEVLTAVRSHPTIFPLVDRAIDVGGWPLQRVGLVHGPSGMGKTLFVHGLGLSFLTAANFYAFVDAEYTTPVEWLAMLMAGQVSNPGFIAQRPESYEETVNGVREFAEGIANDRATGKLPPDITGLIVVDSIRKLVPKKLLDKILSGKGGMDGASGRGAMMKAALNAQWLDELVPTLYHANLGMVFISREYENSDTNTLKLQDPGGGFDYKVGGGKALIFESSIVARVTRSWVKDGSAEDAKVIGEKHHVTITKTKVAGKEDKTTVGHFHTSNGRLTPVGFDRARDVFNLAVDAGVLKQAGSWYSWPKLGMKWQGENKTVKALSDDRALLDTLEGEAR